MADGGGGGDVARSHWPRVGGRAVDMSERRGKKRPAVRRELDLGFDLRGNFGGRHIFIGRGS